MDCPNFLLQNQTALLVVHASVLDQPNTKWQVLTIKSTAKQILYLPCEIMNAFKWRGQL